PLDGHSLDIFDELGRVTVSLREEEHPVFLPSYRGVVGVTKAASRFNERLQHRLEIESRAADNLEHIGGGCLVLQRFTEIARARLHLLEQPCVLDGDDSLRGKILDQTYLLIVEGADLLAINSDRTNQVVFLEHWHDQKRPSPGNLRNRLIG